MANYLIPDTFILLMAEKPETKFRRYAVARLEKLPVTTILSIQQMAIVGTPDLILCIHGFFIALELKASEKARIRPAQSYILKRLSDSKGIGLVVYPENFEKVFGFLKNIAYGEGYYDRREVQELQDPRIFSLAAKAGAA